MRKKDRKHRQKKKSRTERTLIGGILLTCLFLCSIIFYFIHPFTLKDAGHFIGGLWAEVCSVSSQAAQKAGQLWDSCSEIFAEKPESAPSPGALSSPSSTARQSGVQEESIPYLVYSEVQGDIADLHQEPEEYDDSIYVVMLDTAAGPMLYYNQGDARWGDFLYGGTDPMRKYGCGPTAIAMLIDSFTLNNVTPVETAQWAYDNGYFSKGSGSYHSLIPDGLAAFGLSVKSVSPLTEEKARAELEEGHLLVALMGPGSLTQSGHFVIITQECGSENVHIADPNSYANSCAQWSLSQLLGELKNNRDSGGPLWAVWPP